MKTFNIPRNNVLNLAVGRRINIIVRTFMGLLPPSVVSELESSGFRRILRRKTKLAPTNKDLLRIEYLRTIT